MNKLTDRNFVCMELLIDKFEAISNTCPRGWRVRLARKLNVSPAYITLIMKGERIPSLYVYNNIMNTKDDLS